MNWGHKIIIVFVLFAAGILTMVISSIRTRIEMVTPNYYAEELKYQQIIDGRREAGNLSSPVNINQSEEALELVFPPEMQGVTLEGSVLFYRASDASRDVRLPLRPDTYGAMPVSKKRFRRGNYKVQLQWEAGGKSYFQESFVTVN